MAVNIINLIDHKQPFGLPALSGVFIAGVTDTLVTSPSFHGGADDVSWADGL